MSFIPYHEKLKDPRWQKRRLDLFNAADWTCKKCGTKTKTLHAHHGCYKRNTDPWDYPDEVMHVLCDECHEQAQKIMENLHFQIAKFSAFESATLFMLLELLADQEDKSKVLRVLTSLLSSAASTSKWPENHADIRWAVDISRETELEQVSISSFNRGAEFAHAASKGSA